MKKKVKDSQKKGTRAKTRKLSSNPAKAREITDAELDKVRGGAVGPCEYPRTRNTA
jgi:hypothetical protein